MAARPTSLAKRREELEVELLSLKIRDTEEVMLHRNSMLKNEYFRSFIQGATFATIFLSAVVAGVGWLVLNADKVKAFLGN